MSPVATQLAHPIAATAEARRSPLSIVRDLKVRTKLLASFTAVCLLLVLLGGVSLTKLSESKHRLNQMYSNSLLSVAQIDAISVGVLTVGSNLRDIAIALSKTDILAAEANLTAADQTLDAAVAAYAQPQDPATFAKFKTDLVSYRSARVQAIAYGADNQNDKFISYMKSTLTPLRNQLNADLARMSAAEKANALASLKVGSAEAAAANQLVIVVIVLASALALLLAITISNLITRPLNEVKRVLQGLAAGRLDQQVMVTDRSEVGAIGEALNTSVAIMRSTLSSISDYARVLAASSQELTSVSTVVSSSAEESSVQAQVVSAAAEQISRNIATVSAGGEEMGSAIREIATSTSQATEVAGRAAVTAVAANDTITRLGESSEEIGKVVKSITTIAEQTNLLALNATIEAARAGELGKGFAVVANEVKELAQAAARATEDISSRVATTQADVREAVTAIENITEVIGQINDIQTTIASAVEQQSATTNEMVRNVTEVATGSAEIAANVTGIATAAEQTTTSASQTSQAASALSRIADDLNGSVATFTL